MSAKRIEQLAANVQTCLETFRAQHERLERFVERRNEAAWKVRDAQNELRVAEIEAEYVRKDAETAKSFLSQARKALDAWTKAPQCQDCTGCDFGMSTTCPNVPVIK